MDLTLLKDGVFVMLIGMGTVFVFLTIMIFAMNVNAKVLTIVNKYFPEEEPVTKKPCKNNAQKDDAEIALAIACAMHKAAQRA